MADSDDIFEDDGLNSNDLLAAVESIFNDVGIEMKSVLNQKQILAIAVGLTFAKKYNIPLLEGLCELLMQLKVSDKGTGRRDLRAVLTSKIQKLSDRERMRDRLLG